MKVYWISRDAVMPILPAVHYRRERQYMTIVFPYFGAVCFDWHPIWKIVKERHG